MVVATKEEPMPVVTPWVVGNNGTRLMLLLVGMAVVFAIARVVVPNTIRTDYRHFRLSSSLVVGWKQKQEDTHHYYSHFLRRHIHQRTRMGVVVVVCNNMDCLAAVVAAVVAVDYYSWGWTISYVTKINYDYFYFSANPLSLGCYLYAPSIPCLFVLEHNACSRSLFLGTL